MRFSSVLVSAVLLGILGPLPFVERRAQADGFATRPDILQVNELRPGMTGYGLTVFRGTRPERFNVEVIDVIREMQPRQDIILVKTEHPRLEVAKVVAGMSGSPIYIGGKMIGAYSYGWDFPSEPVAGVTPIRYMLDDLARPIPPTINGLPVRWLPSQAPNQAVQNRVPADRQRFQGPTARYDLQKHAEQLAQSRVAAVAGNHGFAPVVTPLLMGGVSAATLGAARALFAPLGLEPLKAGGSAAAGASGADRYQDGGAISIDLVRGDINVYELGTVTRVENDKLVAFGHPMLEAGITALPASVAQVTWFMATEQKSFKLGAPVHGLGALLNDRQASIVVSQSASAPVIPVVLSIKGVPGTRSGVWKFNLAHEKFLTPSMLVLGLSNSIQAAGNEMQDVTWEMQSKLKIRSYGTLALEDFGVGIGGSPSLPEIGRTNLVRALGAILNNPWQAPQIEELHVEFEMRFAREVLQLRGVQLLTPEVEAGADAKLRLLLTPFNGAPESRVISVPIPAYLAGQSVVLDINPGHTEEDERAAPETLAELIRNFANPIYPARSVVVSFNSGENGLSFKGRVAKNLPPGAYDTIRSSTSTVAPEAFLSAARTVVNLGSFMTGKDRVSLEVRPVLR